MARLTVHPHDLTPVEAPVALAAMGLGPLNAAVVRTLKRKINGDWSLSISYPAKLPEAALLVEDNLIECFGQLYRIERIDEKNIRQGRMITVEAPHLFYDLDKYDEITNIETAEDDTYPDGITAQQALSQLLAGTAFSPGTVDVPEKLDFLEVLQKAPLSEIKGQLLEKWGGELQPDNWTVHLRSQIGSADRKYHISHRRNTNDVRCLVDIKPVITRLHVAGYDGATFESINDGKDYIDSPNIGLYAYPRHGRITFDDIDDPAELKAKAEEYLPTVDKPVITLEVKLANLKGSPLHALYKNLESLDLGDTAIYDHPKYGRLEVRMIEQEQDVYTEENTRVVLGSPKQSILSSITTAQASADTLARLVTGKGQLRANKLAGSIDLMRILLQMSGSYQNAEVIEGRGLLFQNLDPESPEYGAMYHGPGIVALASSKNPDGSWDWRIGITPRGIIGDEVDIEATAGVHISASAYLAELAEGVGAVSGGLDDLQAQVDVIPGSISAAINQVIAGTYQKVAGIDIDANGVNILGKAVRMITQLLYISNDENEATAALIIDMVDKIVRANSLQTKLLNLEGTLSGVNNVMLKGSLSVINVPAGSNLQSIEDGIPKYLENNLTVTVATGTYNVGNWLIKNHSGAHVKWVFAAGVIINAASIELHNNPSGISFVGNSGSPTQINTTSNNSGIYGKRCGGGEFAYLRVTGKARTSATDGLATGLLFEDCNGLYVHHNIVERTKSYTMFFERCSGLWVIDNVGGYSGGNYTTLANLGEGIAGIHTYGAAQNTVPIAVTNAVFAWLGDFKTYNITQAASPGAPSTPTTQTVKYVYNSSAYCDLPSSAGMGSAASSWPSGAPRGGLYSSQSKRYAGMWLCKLEGGAVQNILTGLAGKTILAANLTVHCDTYNGSAGSTQDLYYMLHNVLPPNGTSPGSRLTDTGYNLSPADGTSQTLNLTAWLQSMVNAGTPFYGFGLGTAGTYARYDLTCTFEITYQV